MAWTTYLSKYVFDRSAIQANKPKQQITSITIGRDFQRQARYTFERSETAIERDITLTSSLDAFDVRRFHRTHAGMLTAFWLPTFTRDFPLVRGEAGGATALRISKSALNILDARTRHIYLPRLGHRCRITSITDQTTYYSIGLNIAVSEAILGDDVVCALLYVRFSDDSFTLKHVQAGIWETTLSFEELPREVPVT